MQKGKNILTCQDSSYGGINLAINMLSKWKIKEMIDGCLGKRNARAEYSYGEIILQYFYSKCCTAKRTERLKDNKIDIDSHPLLSKAMSPDTFLRMLDEIPVTHKQYDKDSLSESVIKRLQKDPTYAHHHFYENSSFNELNFDLAIEFGLIDLNKGYIIDFDTTVVETKVKGSHIFYNGGGKTGYQPAVAMIDKVPLFIQNRNGDTNASFNQVETLDKILSLCKKKKTKIDMVRIDAAGFNKELIAYLSWKKVKYVTRAHSRRVNKEKNQIDTWTEEIIKNETKILGETTFKYGRETVRLIVKKEYENGKPKYWGVATNEMEMSAKEILETYAKRGDCENLFSGLNELHWDIMPKRTIESNTVFMHTEAVCYILYRGLVESMAKRTKDFYKKMKFSTFIKALMAPSKWLKKQLKFPPSITKFIGLEEFFFFFDTGPPYRILSG